MEIKLQIEDGELLKMKGPFNDDPIFTKKYAKPRDNYWGPFPYSKSRELQHDEDKKRDGDKEFNYDTFWDMVTKSDIGIWLEIIGFKTDTVSINPHSYSKMDLDADLASDKILTKLIITKRSLLKAKKIWKTRKMNSKKIKFGIGKDSNENPVVFIHPDNGGSYQEVDWPVRVPKEN